MSYISEETWQVEKHLAIKSLDSTGHLPENGQSGGRFWDMVRTHYLNDVKTTGNDHRFLENHCRFVDHYVPLEFAPKPLPALPPVTWLPVPPMPSAPPVICIPAPPPMSPPSCTQPPHTGHPGTPGGVVAEPAGLVLAGIGLVICWIGGQIVSTRNRTV